MPLYLTRSAAVLGLLLGTAAICHGQSTMTSSNNYLESVELPRWAGPGEAPDLPSQTALERAVTAHNRQMAENPAAKNRNRIVYFNDPRQYRPVQFPVKAATAVMDGAGRVLGYLAPEVHTVELNFGQRKRIGDQDCVMVFAALIKGSGAGSREGATGWIAENALLPSPERTQFAKELATDVHDTAETGDAPEHDRVECGDPAEWESGRLKIMPRVNDSKEKHMAATDYVRRPSGVCYLLSRLPGHGGVAGDTLSDGAEFVPDAGVPRAEVPLYLPTDATAEERAAWESGKLPHRMEFRYGRTGSRYGRRYGWIASADLHAENGS